MPHYLTKVDSPEHKKPGHTDEVSWNGVETPLPDDPALHCQIDDWPEDPLWDGWPLPETQFRHRVFVWWGKKRLHFHF